MFVCLFLIICLVALGHHCRVQSFSSCGVRASHHSGFSCGAQALGARASVVELPGLKHVESSQARN